jgi:anti-sigma regulatory factor (Ser/Thr protein kinase)
MNENVLPIEINIESEIKLFEDKLIFENFLKKVISGNLDFEPLIIIFSELYMNVCQHSNTDNGKCIIEAPDNNGNIKILFSDNGVGVVENIKSYFKNINFENDNECIEYALREKITTKSKINNQGAGLNTVKRIVSSMNGSLIIKSHKGSYEFINGNIKKSELNHFYQGTSIDIILNLNQLDKKEISDYSNSLEF